mgnify:FL=1
MQLAVREKKLSFKRWQSVGIENVHEHYREKNRLAKRKVAIVRNFLESSLVSYQYFWAL